MPIFTKHLFEVHSNLLLRMYSSSSFPAAPSRRRVSWACVVKVAPSRADVLDCHFALPLRHKQHPRLKCDERFPTHTLGALLPKEEIQEN